MEKCRAHTARAAGTREERELLDKARIPKVDKMLLLPMPEASARTAALLSGQVDWIEAPSPDAVAEIKQRGFLSRPTRSRMSGRGSFRALKARHGTIFASARLPIFASIARA